MTIGEKIRELRRGRDMTQEELASSLGVAYQTVSKWETGATSPDLGLIVPIARLFRVEPSGETEVPVWKRVLAFVLVLVAAALCVIF